MGNRAIMNWSGGKDSALALASIIEDDKINVDYLFTTLSTENKRISMHGVREELLDMQARSIGIPLRKIFLPELTSMHDYSIAIENAMQVFRDEEIDKAIYGDIFLEDLRQYREEQLKKVEFSAVFPLWKDDTAKLIRKFLDLGFKTVVTCVNEKYLDRSFTGRIIDESFLNEIPSDVDPCGENGEFHTFVFDGPIFNQPISYRIYA